MALKILTVYGKTLEDLQKLDLKEFAKLIPARARRSLLRGQHEQDKQLLEAIKSGDQNIRTHRRDMIIIPQMVGALIKVYNGKEWLPIQIELEMVGHYLGEFAQTRRRVAHSAPGIGATRSSAALSVR